MSEALIHSQVFVYLYSNRKNWNFSTSLTFNFERITREPWMGPQLRERGWIIKWNCASCFELTRQIWETSGFHSLKWHISLFKIAMLVTSEIFLNIYPWLTKHWSTLFLTITTTKNGCFPTIGSPYHPFLIKNISSLQKILLTLWQVYLIHIKVWTCGLNALNLGSKLKQGWLNLLNNEKQLFSATSTIFHK